MKQRRGTIVYVRGCHHSRMGRERLHQNSHSLRLRLRLRPTAAELVPLSFLPLAYHHLPGGGCSGIFLLYTTHSLSRGSLWAGTFREFLYHLHLTNSNIVLLFENLESLDYFWWCWFLGIDEVFEVVDLGFDYLSRPFVILLRAQCAFDLGVVGCFAADFFFINLGLIYFKEGFLSVVLNTEHLGRRPLLRNFFSILRVADCE